MGDDHIINSDYFAAGGPHPKRSKYNAKSIEQAVGELQAFANTLSRGPAQITADQLNEVLQIVRAVLVHGNVGVCQVCRYVGTLNKGICEQRLLRQPQQTSQDVVGLIRAVIDSPDDDEGGMSIFDAYFAIEKIVKDYYGEKVE